MTIFVVQHLAQNLQLVIAISLFGGFGLVISSASSQLLSLSLLVVVAILAHFMDLKQCQYQVRGNTTRNGKNNSPGWSMMKILKVLFARSAENQEKTAKYWRFMGPKTIQKLEEGLGEDESPF